MKAKDFLTILLILICSGIIMHFGKSVLIPFVLAMLVWYVIKDLRDRVGRTKFGKVTPHWLHNSITLILVFGILFLLGQILKMNISNMMEMLPEYQDNFNKMIPQINQLLGVDVGSLIENFEFSSMIGTVLGSLSNILSSAFMIVLYVVFMMMEESTMKQRMTNMYHDKEKLNATLEMVSDINNSISNYISLKTVVSIVTGVLSYLALLLLGVDFPVFWAIIIFLLNYIPTIGSLIATIFPTLMAWLQFNDIYTALYVLLAVGTIQLIVGNLIEPKVMGNSLNISPLVVILSLSVFGALWGITGMILCVPFTVILIIIFSHFESTRSIAVLLSDSGTLDENDVV